MNHKIVMLTDPMDRRIVAMAAVASIEMGKHPEYVIAAIADAYNASGVPIYAMTVDDRPVGGAVCTKPAFQHSMRVDYLMIAEGKRGRGYGHALASHIVESRALVSVAVVADDFRNFWQKAGLRHWVPATDGSGYMIGATSRRAAYLPVKRPKPSPEALAAAHRFFRR